MALPEFSQVREVPVHVHVDLYGKEDEQVFVQAELEYALAAAVIAVGKAEGTFSYAAARDAAKTLHLLDACARPSCTPSVSDLVWETVPQVIDVLVSKDALFMEAQRWFESSAFAALLCGQELRAAYVAWWTRRVGAEHATLARRQFPSQRCQAIWIACRAHWLALSP